MQKLLVANWKAQKNIVQVEYWLNNFPKDLLLGRPDLRLLIAPPYPFLSQMSRLIDRQQLPIELAVQDVSGFGAGAFTGEVAASNLEFLGVKMAIVGHSERRRLLRESSQDIASKIQQALAAKLEVLLCLDEPYFVEQAKLLTAAERRAVKIAYEPVAAIGSGQASDPPAVAAFLESLREYFPDNQLLYGGSVNASNVKDFLAICDGVLIGGASLEISDLTALIQATA